MCGSVTDHPYKSVYYNSVWHTYSFLASSPDYFQPLGECKLYITVFQPYKYLNNSPSLEQVRAASN